MPTQRFDNSRFTVRDGDPDFIQQDKDPDITVRDQDPDFVLDNWSTHERFLLQEDGSKFIQENGKFFFIE